jgi:glutamyl-Q tRNA(Asp) synthetase
LSRTASFPASGKTRDFAQAPTGTPKPPQQQYVGRFAPSPTGALHLGSLVAAVGSFADARCRGGRWLLRMEDLDRRRLVAGAAQQMLLTLEALGLHWDGAVEYQSTRTAHYREALDELISRGLTFECSCSRREREGQGGYAGRCRGGPQRPGPTATRLRVGDGALSFEDRAQGTCTFAMRERGDVVIRRRDGVFAYQLAVVIDDALQGITDVVRGADLLDSTPWQLTLQRALGLLQPAYLHLPLVLEPDGRKLAKSSRCVPVDALQAGHELCRALTLLRQDPPAKLELEPGPAVLAWACSNWRPERLRGLREVRLAG